MGREREPWIKNPEMGPSQRGHIGKAMSTISNKEDAPCMTTLGKEVAEFLDYPVNCYTTWIVKTILPFIQSLLFILSSKANPFVLSSGAIENRWSYHPLHLSMNHTKPTMFFWRDNIVFDNTERHIPVCSSQRNLPDFITNELFKGILPDVFNSTSINSASPVDLVLYYELLEGPLEI